MMELASLPLLCVTFICSVFLWTFVSGVPYYFKWITIYVLFKWRRLMSEDPEIPLFASKKEEYLEKPRIWTKEKTFQRESMLVFAGGKDVRLLLELARGCHNSAVARLRLQIGSTEDYETSDEGRGPSACEGWMTSCLALECLEPMRRWRIVFTGRLQDKSGGSCTGNKLVKIKLIWVSLCGPYYYSSDADLYSLISSLATQPLTHLQHNLDALGKGYEQWGTVQGTVDVDGHVTTVHAPSLRRHSWKWPYTSARVGIVGVADNGTLFSITYNFANIRTQLGHVRYSNGRIEPIVGTSLVETKDVGKTFVRTFSSSCESHLAYFVRSPWNHWVGFQWAFARCVLDTQPGTCLVLSWDRSMREDFPLLPLLTWTDCESNELFLPLNHPACSNPSIVGGKAASLALLAGVAHSSLKNKVNVPKGICLTVHAMHLQIQSSQSLTSAVKYLNLITADSQSADLRQECQHIENIWLTVPMCPAVAAILAEQVVPNRSYAVRSSATGEDCADTSAAGQNATVLGCVGLDSVISAVHKCWASLYSFQSVNYRRQAGLPVESAMGVVVQEVVAAESAGVMFTRHPITSDPSQLLITANYGLGETVVSGNVEPDSIVVTSENRQNVKVESVIQGHKDRRLTVTDDGEVNVEALGPELADSLCLTKPEIVALAKVGLSLEQLFGWPRDIEWAINKGVIYLLQCRPVTSLLTWSQEDLEQELDSALMPGDASTTANVGEVLPGATSPLSQSTTLRCLDFEMVHEFAGVRHKLWYNNNKVVISHQCVLLHLYNTLLCRCEEEPTLQQKALELAICGHRVSTPELQKVAAARSPPTSLLQNIRMILHFIQQMLMSSRAAKKAKKMGEDFKINCDSFKTSAALYAYLTSCYKHMMAVFIHHNRVTLANTLWQTILFSILAEGKKELSEENLQDISSLLVGEQKALTAQIPADIKQLAKMIKSSAKEKEVAELPPDRVPAWLEVNNLPAFKLLQDIIQRYQHRNIKELDVMTQTWGLDCRPLVAAVQATLKAQDLNNSERIPTREPDKNIMDQLKSPLKPFNRWLLQRLLGVIRSEAARREITKDACLRVVHEIRLGFLRLAQLLTAEGKLPNSQLIWFSTYHELGQLLSKPHPVLLHKISRRQQLWHLWDQQQFPEVMVGLPIPIEVSHSYSELEKDSWVQGTLVCAGSVRGRACVLLSCTDSQILRPGDILVTHSTDVGWTPLFPLLAGVVTELGGLISHGAVVAREYGLPCIVGAKKATIIFKTGDLVYLDGKTGRVEKISLPT